MYFTLILILSAQIINCDLSHDIKNKDPDDIYDTIINMDLSNEINLALIDNILTDAMNRSDTEQIIVMNMVIINDMIPNAF